MSGTPTTITYNIPAGSLVNQPSVSCGAGNFYNNCNAQQPGFTWTSTGSGTVTAVSIQVNIGVDCNGGSIAATLNGTSSGSLADVSNCFCTSRNNILTYSPSLGSYNVGALNTFLMTPPTSSCLGQCINTTWPAGTYAIVTVTYNEPPAIPAAPGSIGIGTTVPTSPLQVVGLPVYANNAAAIAGGLTVGAFYRTGADPDPVCVVH
jgi:hypothetical protein